MESRSKGRTFCRTKNFKLH